MALPLTRHPLLGAQPGLWMTADKRFVLFRRSREDSDAFRSRCWAVVPSGLTGDPDADRQLLASIGLGRSATFPSRKAILQVLAEAVYPNPPGQ